MRACRRFQLWVQARRSEDADELAEQDEARNQKGGECGRHDPEFTTVLPWHQSSIPNAQTAMEVLAAREHVSGDSDLVAR